MLNFLHRQVFAFLSAGELWEEAQGASERRISRGISLVLVAVALFLTSVPFIQDVVSAATSLRAMYSGSMLFVLAGSFWSGISVRSIAKGAARFWVPAIVLVYAYGVLGSIAIDMSRDGRHMKLGPDPGILMILLGVLGGAASWAQGRGKGPAQNAEERAKVAARRIYLCLSLVMIVGGGVSIAALGGEGRMLVLRVIGR